MPEKAKRVNRVQRVAVQEEDERGRQSQCPIFEGIQHVSNQTTVSLCVGFSSPLNFPVTLRIENSETCICIFKIISLVFVFVFK